MKRKKLKFILTTLLIFILTFSTVPVSAASSPSLDTPVSPEIEDRMIGGIQVSFEQSGLTEALATAYVTATGDVQYIKINIKLQEYSFWAGKYVDCAGPTYSSYTSTTSYLYFTHTFDVSPLKSYRIKVEISVKCNDVVQTETVYESL